MKLARHATGRPNVIVVHGGFHGRTYLDDGDDDVEDRRTAPATSRSPPASSSTTFPRPFEWSVDEADRGRARARRSPPAAATQTAPSETAAIVMEPVLGEGGYLPAPIAFVRGVREICAEHGILFVADEVQTGFARTGRMFAVEHAGVEPDIMVMAKGIASGFPIAGDRRPRRAHGAVAPGRARRHLRRNPIGCAAALATIDVILDEQLVDDVGGGGRQLIEALRELQPRHAGVGDVRGLGPDGRAPSSSTPTARPTRRAPRAVMTHCLDESHVIFMSCGTDGNVMRCMPPLVVSADEIDRGSPRSPPR